MINLVLLIIMLILHLFILLSVISTKEDKYKVERYSFAIVVLTIVLWIITIFLTEIFRTNHMISLLMSRLSFATAAIGAFVFQVFVYTINNMKKGYKKGLLFIGLIASFIFSGISLTDAIVKDVLFENNVLSSTFGKIHPIIGLYLTIHLTYSLLYLILTFVKEQEMYKRIQIFTFLIGLLLSISGTLITNFILPWLGYPETRFLGPLMFVFFLYFSFLAIKTYKFLEVNILGDKIIFVTLLGFFPHALFYLLYFSQTLIWKSILSLNALICSFFLSFVFIIILSLSQNKLQVFLLQLNPQISHKRIRITGKDLYFALKNFNSPNLLSQNIIVNLLSIKTLSRKQNVPIVYALQKTLSNSIESLKPKQQLNKRTASQLKYEILRMIAYEGATESQIMWDLGFDIYNRSVMEKLSEHREPRFKLRDASEYSATSMRSYKRLKKEAIEMLKWKLEEGE